MGETLEFVFDRYGHGIRTYTLVKADAYCVSCGRKTVWEESGSDDYYVGPQYYCTSCRNGFTYQGPDPENSPFMDELVTIAVRTAT